MKTLNVHIGAGFSYNAGLPMAASIATKFNTDFLNKVCRQESQWFWTEGKDDVFVQNGSLDSDVPTMPFVMNEIVSEFKKLKGELDNYELFYAFLLEQKDDFFMPLAERTKKKFFKKFPDMPPAELYTYNFNSFGRWKVIDLINYLIADLLRSSKTDDELINLYQPFINFIKQYDQINIYTTNHDLIIERMLLKLGIPFNDGFTKENSELVHLDTKKPLSIFKNKFSRLILIL